MTWITGIIIILVALILIIETQFRAAYERRMEEYKQDHDEDLV